VVAVEVFQTTLAVLVGLFVLRVLQRFLIQRDVTSKLGAALEFVIGQ
jgi:hypothetical protein